MSIESIGVVFFAIIISGSGIFINFFRKKGKTVFATLSDGGSLTVFRMAVPTALITSVILYLSGIGQQSFPFFLKYTGYPLILSGLILRWWAIYILGRSFTVKLGIVHNHRLVTSGIYKHIRHPSYTGLLMYYLGLGLVMENLLSLGLLILFPLVAVLHRIGKEENVLVSHFGTEYEQYMGQSYRLVPFVY